MPRLLSGFREKLKVMQAGVSKRELVEMLNEASLVPKRSLGQNFLIDKNYAYKIAEACALAGSQLLEIGPGLGSLSVPLAELVGSVVAIEKDQRIAEVLSRLVQSRAIGNLEVVAGDALEVDLESLMRTRSLCGIVGNLPYNISVPLIMKIIEEVPTALEMVFLVQTEVAQRLCANPGTRDSSFASLKVQLFCEVRLEMKVPNTVFVPVPNVSSSLIKLSRSTKFVMGRSQSVIDAALGAAKRAFAHRRQMLRRTLELNLFGEALIASGIDPTRRPESLRITEWLDLGEAIVTLELSL